MSWHVDDADVVFPQLANHSYKGGMHNVYETEDSRAGKVRENGKQDHRHFDPTECRYREGEIDNVVIMLLNDSTSRISNKPAT